MTRPTDTATTRVGRPRYEIERELGRGGMATVYLARDRELDRPVALKVLAEHLAHDDDFRARFLREARLAARLSHRGIVKVYDVGEDERGLQMVMEYVEGETLDELLRRRGPLPPAEAVAITTQVLGGLEAAHRAGLVHRDVKPQNVLLASDGTAKLTDFGIARAHDGTALTAHGTVLGTASYLAPEQARGEPVTAAADLYGTGVVLYELLTGRIPYAARTLPEIVAQRESGAIVPPREIVPAIPPPLERAVLHALAVRPEDRPSSAAAMAAELTAALPTAPLASPAVAPTASTRSLVRAGSRRRLKLAVALVAVAALAALLLGLALAGGGKHPQRVARRPAAAHVRRAAPPLKPLPTTTAAAPAATRATPAAPSCATLQAERDALEQRKHALHGKRGEDERKALDEQRKALDHTLKGCHR